MRRIVGQSDNRDMPRVIAAAGLLLLAACTPTFNWREVPVESTGLRATLPCKPDKAERRTQLMPGRDIVLHAMGCETGGVSFAILHGDVGGFGELSAALAQWRKASAATLHSTAVSEQPWQPAGALSLPASTMVRIAGSGADGGEMQMQSAYFAHGTEVFQAFVYAPKLKPEMTEPFFAGLRFE
jgi:hypothetical protein